ncbi:hypothetical protein CAPTEDRAFT_223125 [Capitella teleta]|uniref:Kanadaptin n=1 Tax=Capitella teleta TaxID=283909 RepID=R7V1Z8_CAPTE|nr:hypothetical protein CAPTEDRAFT_223125 [Capitella teleta]|eukprot:ELU12873.1 hypothetical protein CAPTEDRAFT_223125 [Capitella teleta]
MAEANIEKSSVDDVKSPIFASDSQDDAMSGADNELTTQSHQTAKMNSGSLANGASEADTPHDAVAAENTIPNTDTVDLIASETQNGSVNETELVTKNEVFEVPAPVQFKMPSMGPRKPSASVKAALSDTSDPGKSSNSDESIAKDSKPASDSSNKSDDTQKSIPEAKQLSTAEKSKQNALVVPYKEPDWGGICEKKYSFEIVKSAEDAPPDMELNPFTIGEAKNEKLYLDDPKKALKGFFEREGYDLPEYEFVDSSCGKHTCRVELPVDLLSSATGEPLYGEASMQGKKKDVVIACALDACRILDKHDLLRRSKHESRAKKKKNWKQEDYYDSDDDEFLDRTGDIERKRKMRMKMFGHKKEQAATYESLVPQLEEVEKEIAELELKLEKAKSETETLEAQGMDALDAYMTAIKAGNMDTKTRMSIKRSLVDLRREQQRLSAMVKVARPVHLPSLQKLPAQPEKLKSSSMPMFGKMKGHGKTAGRLVVPQEEGVGKVGEEEEMKVEEDSEEEEKEEEIAEEGKKGGEEEAKESEKVVVEDEKINTESEMDESPAKKEAESPVAESDLNSETVKSVSQKVKKKRKISAPKMVKDEDTANSEEPEKKARKKAEELLTSKEYCDDDPDYATWVPPQGQTGDGKTHLNDKYGY